MNREIKFRAWENENGRNRMFEWKEVKKDFELWLNCKDTFVMQFTGLQDKNGNDIYEGDIVTYYNKYSGTKFTHIVKYDDKFACFGLFEEGNEWCKESDWMIILNIEVIGNIFQNPELISND